ncbi:MAG: hypothetical protein OSB16_11080 [Planktomarina sp.]|nr:hypothetical protein [Planktomarina sp.]MDE0970565.1 hypothetical protein [Octadecabacter sp.]MDT2058558.1 hypothetical protein [Planktomarina sp.]
MSLILEGMLKVTNGQTHARRGLRFSLSTVRCLIDLARPTPKTAVPGF